MHSKPMSESEGTFGDIEHILNICSRCKKQALHKQIWESNCGGYEDIKITCSACGYHYWIEGSDS